MKEKYRHPQFSSKGLVAYCKLYAGLKSTARVFDYSLNGVIGTVVGTDIAPAYPGFSFNGTDDRIELVLGPSIVNTIVIWTKIVGMQSKGIIDLNNTDYVDFDTSAIALTGFVGGTTIVYIDAVVTAAVSTDWVMVGVTTTTGRNASAGNMSIGRSPTDFFNGKIGETMLFDRVLTQVEIKSIYELTRWRYPNN